MIHLFGAGFGSLTDSMLGQLSGQEETDRCLDFATRNGRSSIVVDEFSSLVGDSLEDVVDERVHDAHRLARDARVWVDLLQHLVDVDGVGLLPLLASLAFAFHSSLWLDCLL